MRLLLSLLFATLGAAETAAPHPALPAPAVKQAVVLDAATPPLGVQFEEVLATTDCWKSLDEHLGDKGVLFAIADAMKANDWKAMRAAMSSIPECHQFELVAWIEAHLEKDKGDSSKYIERKIKRALSHWNDWRVLDVVAWDLLSEKSLDRTQLETLDACCQRALELTDSLQPTVLETVARLRWIQGDKEAALRFQKQAAQLLQKESEWKKTEAEQMQKDLETYEKGTLPMQRRSCGC